MVTAKSFFRFSLGDGKLTGWYNGAENALLCNRLVVDKQVLIKTPFFRIAVNVGRYFNVWFTIRLSYIVVEQSLSLISV